MTSLAASSAGPPVPLKSLLPLAAGGAEVQGPNYARNDGNITGSLQVGTALAPPSRPGLGRHMSSVSNLIDAYTSSPRGSASFSGGAVFTPPSPSYIVSGKPEVQSPSSPLRQSQIPLPLGGRRASVDAAAARQDSSGDPVSRGRGRRPSAPDIFWPTALSGTRASSTRTASATASTIESQAPIRAAPTVIDRPPQPPANSPPAPSSSSAPAPQPVGASAVGGNGHETMNGTIDVKRLLSKPAPPQQHVQHHSSLHSQQGSSVPPSAVPNLAIRESAPSAHATTGTSSGFTTAAADASRVASSSSSAKTSHAIGQQNPALSSSTSAAMRAEVVEAKPSSLAEGDTLASKGARSSSVTELVSDPADSATFTANSSNMGASQSLAHTASSPHVLALSFEPHNSRLPFFEHATARDGVDSTSPHYSARQAGTSAHPSNDDRGAFEGRSSSMSAVNQAQTHAQTSSASDSRAGLLQHERLASPQTPRKTRNNDTTMASADSIGAYSPRSSSILRSPDSSSPPRRHTSTHARPLPGPSGQSPFSASSPSTITLRKDHEPYGADSHDQPSRQHGMLPLQPAFPPITGIVPQSTNLSGEPFESVLPPSSVLRPGPRQRLDNSYATHHPTLQHSSQSSPIFSTSSSSATSPSTSKHNSPLHHRGSTTTNHSVNGKILSPTGLSNGSPSQTARKLVRKSSRGHMKKDAGTPGSDMLPSHSRSLSITRVAPSTRSDGHVRSSTTGNPGSGSSSEQEESASANLEHCYSLAHRPAWLDQDPTTSLHHNHTLNYSSQHVWPPASLHKESSPRLSADHNNIRRPRTPTRTSLGRDASTGSAPSSTEESPQTLPKRKPSFYRRKRSQTASSVPVATDRNGFPMPSPLSEMVKNMPITGQDNSLTHQLQPKRSTSGGGFLSSLTKKLSHPNLKEATSFDTVGLEPSPDYFGGRLSQDTLDKPNFHPKTVQSSPKPPQSNTGSAFAPKAWLASLTGHAGMEAKPDSKALPGLPTAVQIQNSGKVMYEDPFSAASSISLPASGFPSRKDSLASQRSDPGDHGSRKLRSRSRTLSNDGDSSEGHSSEGGHAPNRNFDLSPPPVPDLPAGMRLAVSPPNAAPASIPRSTKKSGSSLLRSPSLGFRRPGPAAQDSSPKPQHKGDQNAVPSKGLTRQVDGISEDGTFTSQPRRLSLQALDKANDSITTARKHGLSLTSGSAVKMSERDIEAPSKLGSVAALDKIAIAEDNLRETKFMALLDRSDRADQGVIKLSLASSAAREAGIA